MGSHLYNNTAFWAVAIHSYPNVGYRCIEQLFYVILYIVIITAFSYLCTSEYDKKRKKISRTICERDGFVSYERKWQKQK